MDEHELEMRMTEDEILRKLEQSREQAKQGMYRDAGEVITDMREKYHLRGLQRDDDLLGTPVAKARVVLKAAEPGR